MAINALTTSGINSLVNSYIQSESLKRITPLKERQNKVNDLSSAYNNLLNQIDALKNALSILKDTSTSNVFSSKNINSSNESRVTASVASKATSGTYHLRVNQLAKNDTILSIDKNSNSFASLTAPGEYSFTIKTGDGQNGAYNSKIKVSLNANDFASGGITFASLANKIHQAISSNSPEVQSTLVSGSRLSGGHFKFVFGSAEHTINYSAGNYQEVIDEIVNQLNDITGISAEKITQGGTYGLKIISNDNSKFLQLKDDSDSILSDLGIANYKFISASKIITASAFSPESGKTQLSISTLNSGSSFRIIELSEDSSNGLLNEFGINLGTNRPSFNQNESGEDVAGFLYQTNQLNAILNLNGVQIQRNSNQITDLIEGARINLLSISQNNEADVILTISNNASGIKSKIDSFITNFNNLYKYLKDNSTTTKEKRGLLVGDSNAISLMNILSSSVVNPLQGFSSSVINTLTKLGITFNVNSGLTISDESRLLNSIQTNISEVESFFTLNNGFAQKLYDAINLYSGSTGYLGKAQNQLRSNITNLNDTISNSEARIKKTADRLRAQYQKLQNQLASLLSNQFYFANNMFNQQGF
jgi:flagellar hook-associated protein 2